MTIKHLYPTSRPSLDLQFARDKKLDPRITYSRSSSGTYIDAAGVLQSAATNAARFDHNPSTGESLGLLVEEARTNSWTYSDRFDNADWTKTNVVAIPNMLLAPDGSFTAGLLRSQAAGTATVNRTFTRNNPAFSVFIKTGTSSTANIKIQSDVVGRNVSYNVNLSTGVLTAGTGNTGNLTGWTEYTSITSVGNGWYRIFIGFVSSTTTVNSTYSISPSSNGSAAAANESVYIWGSQLETGPYPTSYIPTPATFTGRTSTATYYDASGVIQTALSGVARSNAYFPDSNGVMRSAGLLLEAAGTNLLNGSQTLATSGGTQNNWVDTNITRDGTLRTSPDSTANALRVTAAAANATLISSAAIGTSAQRTFSIFLRRVTGTGNIDYTLDNGATWTTQAITSSWVRYSFPATTANQQVGIRIATSGDAIELWGAQLETGPYPTSYIPTTTSTVTRSADTSTSATVTRSADVAQITGTNFSSWYNQSEGTVYLNTTSTLDTSNSHYISFNDGTTNNRIGIWGVSTNATKALSVLSGTSISLSPSTAFTGSSFKAAFAAKPGSYGFNYNSFSNLTTSSSAQTLPTVDRLSFGAASGGTTTFSFTVNRLTYYSVRLPDATLQTLTK